jgi:hypothetical protein
MCGLAVGDKHRDHFIFIAQPELQWAYGILTSFDIVIYWTEVYMTRGHSCAVVNFRYEGFQIRYQLHTS